MIASNENPAVLATLTIGRGIVDVNTAVLGFQEHDGKTDWTSAPFNAQPYRNYCQGDVTLNSNALFRVNGTLTLGFTADTNPEVSAQQYNTRGTLTINSGATVIASNIVVDGGLNFVSISQPRQNAISINTGGTLMVTNSLGASPGLPLDNLNMGSGSTLTLF